MIFAGTFVAVGPVQVAWLLVGGRHESGSCEGCGTNLLEVTVNPDAARVLDRAQSGLAAVVVALAIGVFVHRWRQASPRLRFAIAPMLWTAAGALVVLLLWAV